MLTFDLPRPRRGRRRRDGDRGPRSVCTAPQRGPGLASGRGSQPLPLTPHPCENECPRPGLRKELRRNGARESRGLPAGRGDEAGTRSPAPAPRGESAVRAGAERCPTRSGTEGGRRNPQRDPGSSQDLRHTNTETDWVLITISYQRLLKTHTMCPRELSKRVLNSIRLGAVMTSLGSLFQCPTTLQATC
ncbi:uncharacterized protein [Taeniopygia guttata]|uniref:uncharacterized protein isoform X2 n=1 Tax=Taeniopygia guttata TaxID=59729 RepID=UPI003BB88370